MNTQNLTHTLLDRLLCLPLLCQIKSSSQWLLGIRISKTDDWGDIQYEHEARELSEDNAQTHTFWIWSSAWSPAGSPAAFAAAAASASTAGSAAAAAPGDWVCVCVSACVVVYVSVRVSVCVGVNEVSWFNLAMAPYVEFVCVWMCVSVSENLCGCM